MRLHFNTFGNWAYPRVKLAVYKCWGRKGDYDRTGLCFCIFKKRIVIGYSIYKPLKKGYWQNEK